MWSDVLHNRRSGSDLLWLYSHDWNCTKYQFSTGRSPQQQITDVYNDPFVKNLLKNSPHLRKKVDGILEEMGHTWSLKVIRFVGLFLTKLIKSVYRKIFVFDGISIDSNSYYFSLQSNHGLSQTLNAFAREAPILYCPNHRSYGDFLIFSYICFHYNLPLPAIAAGIDFLSLNQISSLLRACGAFFIRRSFKNSCDKVYWEIFRSYVHTQIRGGERPVEFFVEGTRSRSGKSLYPKIGLLGVALELYLTSQIPDLIIVPIGISYERTLEEQLYAHELCSPKFYSKSGTKPKETPTHLLQGARSILSDDYGYIYIKFGQPISLRDMSETYQLRCSHGRDSLSNTDFKYTEEDMEFISDMSKVIILKQQENLVISIFTLFVVSISSEYLPIFRNEKLMPISISFDFRKAVEDIKSLAFFIPKKNLSNDLLNMSIDEAFIDCLGIHRNLAALSADKTCIHINLNDPMVSVQLHHYANQCMQFLINLAFYIYANSLQKFKSLRNIFSREFINRDETLIDDYNRCKDVLSKASGKVDELLTPQVVYYLSSYRDVLIWLKTNENFHSPVNNDQCLVKQIQNDLCLCSDVVNNALSWYAEKKAISKAKDSFLINYDKFYEVESEITILMNSGVTSYATKAKL